MAQRCRRNGWNAAFTRSGGNRLCPAKAKLTKHFLKRRIGECEALNASADKILGTRVIAIITGEVPRACDG
jgi:hypothetical protein